MAKLVLEIQPKNKEATQSVKFLNAEIQTLSKTLSSIKVNKNLTTQINALSQYYTNLAKAAVKVNEATTKRQIAEQKLANEVKRGRTEDQRTLKVKAEREQKELRLKQAQDKATQSTQKQTSATKQGTKANEEHRQSILSMTRGIFEWQIATTLVMKPLRMLRSMLQSINDTLVKTEDTVIAFQRVVGKNISGEAISSELYRLAKDYGQTFENVQSIALDFARTGLSWNDTIKATEAALLGLNTAELDASSAATGLIAVMQQYGLEASQLESIIDKLNITQDNASVTTDKLLTALQRTGSAAHNANLSLEETVALITALSSSTGRSGENLGTAINSLIQYSSKSSALDTFAKLSDKSADVVAGYKRGEYNILDVWKQVAEEIQTRKSDKLDILDAFFETEDGQALKDALDGELEDFYTEMNGVYDTANTFRKNYFIALLGNMDEVEKAMSRMDKSANYSQNQNEDYLKSYTAKVNKLNAQWQEIANSEQGLLGLKKLLVDIGSGLLTILKYTGGIRTILIAVAPIVFSLIGAKVLSGITTIFATLKTGITTLNGLAGWIGVIATAISLIIGLVEQLKQDDQEDFTRNIDNAASSLDNLAESIAKTTDKYDEYIAKVQEARKVLDDGESSTDKLAQAQNTLLEIQNEVIKNNHAYKDSLDLVNGNLDEQIDKLKIISEEKARQQVEDFIRENKSGIYNAEQYLKETFSEIATGESGGLYGGLNDENFALTNFLGGTQGSAADFWGAFGEGFKSLFGGKISGYAQLGEKKTRQEIINWLNEQYDRAAKEIEDEGQRDKIQARIADLIAFYNNDTFKDANSLIYGDNSSSNWIERLTQEQREAFANGELTYDQIKKILGIEEDISKEIAVQTNDISKLKDSYKDIVSKLKELRDISKESTEWEEKKLAVLEAQKALEDARNQATVRRFNETTGQWEWQVDEKAIYDAEKNLQKAEQNLSDETFDRIIELFEKGIATNENIDEIAKDAGSVMGEEFVKTIRDFFQKETGVDISQSPKTETVSKNGSYDSGGIANGLGFMPKATAQPETVNNPELTAKILSPVSNAQFDKYVRDMGIMFEMARQYSHAPVIERVGGATDNRVDNSGQINFAGGLTVGADRRGSSIDELLTLANIIPNT